MKIAGYEAKSILTGSFALDGGAMFGTVPKVLWEKTNPADEKNRIDMEARALLLISDQKKILVDVGLGEKLTEKYGEKFANKFKEMYKWDQSKYSLSKSLHSLGLKEEDITDVILTHLHFDHAGGATIWRNGKLEPTFINAQYYIQSKNLEIARAPNVREKASYFKENFIPLEESGRLKLLNGDVENLLPNVSVFVTNGHTSSAISKSGK
jgi:glyoxylase-like metal-dependent hydrolase (beta-lactamase superfamily II)